jgi:predicted NBD/HSP70 family sugar kinase
MDAIEKSRAGIDGQLLGIGIGVPIWLVQDSRTADNNLFGSIEASLGERFGRTVHVHNNVRAYASYLSGQPAGAGDFALITLRTGVGFGLYMGGKVVQGENGLAGELAHMQADAHGSLCRCGGRGCVETLVGEQAILQRYSAAAGRNCASLSALASLAADGDRGALDALRQSAEILAIPTASLVLTLDIPKIILAGPFGESGILFARMLEERIKTKLFARQKPMVLYDPLDSEGFLHGAALIAMRDFYLPLLRA